MSKLYYVGLICEFCRTWLGRAVFCSPGGVAGADGSSHTGSGLLPPWSACSDRSPQPPAHLGLDSPKDITRDDQ